MLQTFSELITCSQCSKREAKAGQYWQVPHKSPCMFQETADAQELQCTDFFSLNGSANSHLTKYETSSVHLQLQHQYTDFSHKARNSPDQRHSCHSSAGPRRETPLLDHTIKILLFVTVLASFFFFDLDV